jgi:tripeptide aminopeptidase
MYENLVDRFIKYVKVNTRSDASSKTVPSTQSQVDFAKNVLLPDLKEIGLSEVEYNEENGFVTATLPANTDKEVPTIGFIAHIDTADFNAEGVNPRFHENYNGEEIVLDSEGKFVLSPKDFPNLENYIGKTLITTDGSTLLGSDDKSGIVEILSAVEYLIEHPEIEHGKIRVAFGPDEEIGVGADRFDVEHFDADFAYTLDGGPIGELEYESFNAAAAHLTIQGKNVHPGTAKDQMINAMQLAINIHNELPADEVPEHTEKREGFFHLTEFSGTVEEARLSYIIRDHDKDLFNQRKQLLKEIVEKTNAQLDQERVSLDMYDQYYNMREVIEKDMRPVEYAKEAFKALNIEPNIKAIRGGTDGSKISFMGLPTPNLFAGGENFHGRYEFVAVESMHKATDVIVEIAKYAASK